jgi:hypothetical protein
VAARSKARSNNGIVGWNPARGMYVCLRLFSVCAILCRYQPCDELIPCPRGSIVCVKATKVQQRAVERQTDRFEPRECADNKADDEVRVYVII